MHGRLARKKNVPAYLQTIDQAANTIAKTFFQQNYSGFFWIILVYSAITWAAWLNSPFGDEEFYYSVVDWLRFLVYPLFSFAWLRELYQSRTNESASKWKDHQFPPLLTLASVVIVLASAKECVMVAGLFALPYVVFAIRGDLTLALLFSQGCNPVKAYLQSFSLSKGRFMHFSWMFSGLSGLAWVTVMFSRLPFFWYNLCKLQAPASPELMFLLLSIVEPVCIAVFIYLDSIILMRGLLLSEKLKEEAAR